MKTKKNNWHLLCRLKHPVAELFFTCLKFGVLNQEERFCLNVHIIRFHPQTRNLELPFTTLIYSRSKLGL